ncbi:LexA family protein [Enterococcus pallens]|uniref:Peptidase S24/S26A/S26B/S26C domain-containing protein n=1 Tax=Enterococcus pallens ATCC BAA-351 TaxID=1158607 RepID=R2PQ80_9ENTE|nr:S24 family peptidase [Enterococcus pallens]EOH86697.1 hypothetical protein UAU_05142 [Enterococcus pallens ATCC BAA-351]EOU18493.1 hypothetical protein I588_03487 [Enterococcus pallens ATCC BAA-351]
MNCIESVNELLIQPLIADEYGLENLFAFKVEGVEMNRVVLPGSLAIVHQTNEWQDGNIVAVRIENKRMLFRARREDEKVLFVPESRDVFLRSWVYDPSEGLDVEILGEYIYSVNFAS